jgi:hypothetical protein
MLFKIQKKEGDKLTNVMLMATNFKAPPEADDDEIALSVEIAAKRFVDELKEAGLTAEIYSAHLVKNQIVEQPKLAFGGQKFIVRIQANGDKETLKRLMRENKRTIEVELPDH